MRTKICGITRLQDAEAAVQAGARLPPRGRHDDALDVVTLDAVEGRRLVCLVDDADWNQEKARFGSMVGIEIVFDVGLLNFGLTALALANETVFELQLGEKACALAGLSGNAAK